MVWPNYLVLGRSLTCLFHRSLPLTDVNSDKMLHTTDDATFRQMLEVHTVAPFRIIRAAAPYLRIKEEAKRENRSIINISSTSGTHGNVGQINYSAG